MSNDKEFLLQIKELVRQGQAIFRLGTVKRLVAIHAAEVRQLEQRVKELESRVEALENELDSLYRQAAGGGI